jgi:tetratricopeptide (TPR) repeat protein
MLKKAAIAIAGLLLAARLCAGGEPAAPGEAAWQACSTAVTDLKWRGDFDAARRVLRTFLARHGEGPQAGHARRELQSIEEFAERQVATIYASGRTLSERGQFEAALEQYTEIVTRAPSDEWVRKAREGIERNDQVTEAMFNAVRTKCEAMGNNWDFSGAARDAGKFSGAVSGTRWTEPMAKMAEEMGAMRDLFSCVAARIASTRDNPLKTSFKVKDLTGWMVRAEIIGADERELRCLVAGAGRNFTWQELLDEKSEGPAGRFLGVMDLFEPTAAEQLALGILLYRRGFKKAAEERLKLIEKDEKHGARAWRYLELISGSANVSSYDFGSGLQLMDWRAERGRWRLVKGELVQESENGEAELVLAKQAYKAADVRFFFEMAVKGGSGPVSVVFTQDEANSFGFTFSPADGYSAFARVNGKLQTVKDPFKLRTGETVRIRCGVKGDTFALSVGDRKLPRLDAPGLQRLEGYFALSSIDCSVRFDNLSVRNQVE